jgi:hypothetical protein
MALSALTIARNAFLELEEVPLGCFVLDVTIRANIIGQRKQVSLSPDQIGSHPITKLRQLLLDKKHARVGLKLTHFLREDIRNRAESSLEVSAAKSTAYFLQHPTSHFMWPCNDETTKGGWKRQSEVVPSSWLLVLSL